MEEVTQRLGINISAKKSEVLYIGRKEGDVRVEGVKMRGRRMKLVEEFGYLEKVFTSDGKFTQDLEGEPKLHDRSVSGRGGFGKREM